MSKPTCLNFADCFPSDNIIRFVALEETGLIVVAISPGVDSDESGMQCNLSIADEERLRAELNRRHDARQKEQ